MVKKILCVIPALLSSPGHAVADARPWQAELQRARTAYYAGVDGDREAELQARAQFTALQRAHPEDATVRAYMGSLTLLDASHTWLLNRKHSLSVQGVETMDAAVNAEPGNLEARFIRALTTWHLPFYFHLKDKAEADLAFLGPRAEAAARSGALPSFVAAAALDYWGQVLESHAKPDEARQAYQAAARVDKNSSGGADALKRLR